MSETGTPLSSRWPPVVPGDGRRGPDETAADSAMVTSSRPRSQPPYPSHSEETESEATRTGGHAPNIPTNPVQPQHAMTTRQQFQRYPSDPGGGAEELIMAHSSNSNSKKADAENQIITTDDVSASVDSPDAASTRYTMVTTRSTSSGIERALLIDTTNDEVVIARRNEDGKWQETARIPFDELGRGETDTAKIHGNHAMAVVATHAECVDYIGRAWFSFESIDRNSTGVHTFFLEPLDDELGGDDEHGGEGSDPGVVYE